VTPKRTFLQTLTRVALIALAGLGGVGLTMLLLGLAVDGATAIFQSPERVEALRNLTGADSVSFNQLWMGEISFQDYALGLLGFWGQMLLAFGFLWQTVLLGVASTAGLVALVRLCFWAKTLQQTTRDAVDRMKAEEQKRTLAERERDEARSQMLRMHERISDCFILLDEDFKIEYVNVQAKSFLEGTVGYERALEKAPLDRVLPGVDETELGQALNAIVRTRRPTSFEAHLKEQDVHLGVRLFTANGRILMYFKDITNIKNPHVKVQGSARLIKQLMDASPEAVAILDTTWTYLACSRQFLDAFGLESETVPGRKHADVLPFILPDLDDFRDTLLSGQVVHLDEAPYKVDDREEWIDWEIRPWWDDFDKIGGFLLSARFTTESRNARIQAERAREREKRLAYYDQLTGLPNRQLFYDRLGQALAAAYSQMGKVALMFLDLDGFKKVNDTHGHDIGDMLLKEVARRLQGCVRTSDTISRLGGDEFTVILSSINSPDDAANIAQKIIDTIAPPYQLGGVTVRVTTSIGISVYPSDASTSVDLIKYADSSMYEAKQSGKNAYRFHAQQKSISGLDSRDAFNREILTAIQKNEFEVYFQPMFNILRKEVFAMEALVRWRHPEHGLIEPKQFLPVAEEYGSIVELGDWILRRACAYVLEWREKGHPNVRLMVNLSARQFKDRALVENVRRVLAETGIPAESLGFEMPESLILENAGTTFGTLQALKDMGIRLAVDDFGTGYTNMNSLKSFPVDMIKIHQSFIHKLDGSPADEAIVKALITLGTNLGMEVVAEGVETKTQAEFLLENGCVNLQGFLYGRPVKPSKMPQFFDPAAFG
jgi:diguanylate cyclase (GGDEF)-like protein